MRQLSNYEVFDNGILFAVLELRKYIVASSFDEETKAKLEQFAQYLEGDE